MKVVNYAYNFRLRIKLINDLPKSLLCRSKPGHFDKGFIDDGLDHSMIMSRCFPKIVSCYQLNLKHINEMFIHFKDMKIGLHSLDLMMHPS